MTQALKRIAYVEDEPDIRALVELVLTTVSGFELDVSTCGAEAIDRIPKFTPDLILLDVMMPGMDGPEVLQRLEDMPGFPATPTVFMTAKAQPHEVQRYHDLGAAGVITKPFDPMTLAESVQEIWARVQQQQEA